LADAGGTGAKAGALEEVHDLDVARLTAWMEAHVDGFAGPLRYGKVPGGQSNPTYRIEAASGA
jgi:aminoglycoside phosphotransferase (APT) family kinase protein